MTGFVIQYAWGVLDFIIRLDGDTKDTDAGNFFVFYIIVIPFISFTGSTIYKWIDDKGKLVTFTIVNLILAILHGLGLVICAFMFVGIANGIIATVVVLLFLFAAF